MIEQQLRELIDREDIGVILISQNVAERVRNIIIEHDKIIASPLHLGKANVHGRDYRPSKGLQSPDNVAHGTHIPTPAPPT